MEPLTEEFPRESFVANLTAAELTQLWCNDARVPAGQTTKCELKQYAGRLQGQHQSASITNPTQTRKF